MELDDLMDKIDSFMEKKGVSNKDKYFITKLMCDGYLEDIKNEGGEDDEDDDGLLDEFDEDGKEDDELSDDNDDEGEDGDEDDVEDDVVKPKKKLSVIKKPGLKIVGKSRLND